MKQFAQSFGGRMLADLIKLAIVGALSGYITVQSLSVKVGIVRQDQILWQQQTQQQIQVLQSNMNQEYSDLSRRIDRLQRPLSQ